ncbi:hypothetical protein B1A99_10075 [Cohnella sp. CIP 111063]|uniref:MGH1-like glycoside hydrolase domain-containing protein n=1 Tax=unclassified Cohnella TaxID=2636738 RepID=UPI000B8BD39A|nr:MULTISPECIES: hypothetical protein [unclassified Cohnella]OXS59875.1 hypothetical protein B1A99_10075 [Cohnella sp. CIP 111063]PRX72674.1 hypothetical protein B0G52_105227 [Cohnella sp. SGD-V74]
MMKNERLNVGEAEFASSEPKLDAGFRWAKAQALAYAHSGLDPVGLWYEAALPGRNAFCMRDVAHHSAGASVLGLSAHTRNMLLRFAENIAESRDWCTYWEITGDNEPAPVDYTDDADFWYNLPANFDLVDACYRQWLWTGDTDYVRHPAFASFYRRTFEDYIRTWDKDGDGVPEHWPEYGRRGIASYNEDGLQPLVGGDLVAAQFAGSRAYAKLLAEAGDAAGAARYEAEAERLRTLYESGWWDEERGAFFGALLHGGTFYDRYYAEGNYLPLYFGIVKDPRKLRGALAEVARHGAAIVEAKTYMPDLYYRSGDRDNAYRELLELVDPALKRREYPEVSFCVVGAIASGLMGLSADGRSTVSSLGQLPDELAHASLRRVPVLNRVLDLEHVGGRESRLTLRGGEPVEWKAGFSGRHDALLHDGVPVPVSIETSPDGAVTTYALIRVEAGRTHSVRVGE